MPKNGPPPPQSTREGGCPGAVPRTLVSAFSPPVGAWSLGWGVQISPSSTINLRVEPKKEGARSGALALSTCPSNMLKNIYIYIVSSQLFPLLSLPPSILH